MGQKGEGNEGLVSDTEHVLLYFHCLHRYLSSLVCCKRLGSEGLSCVFLSPADPRTVSGALQVLSNEMVFSMCDFVLFHNLLGQLGGWGVE